jgi:hypothetical protein
MAVEGSSSQGVNGLDLPVFSTGLARGSRNGAVGGPQFAQEATIQARLLVLPQHACQQQGVGRARGTGQREALAGGDDGQLHEAGAQRGFQAADKSKTPRREDDGA